MKRTKLLVGLSTLTILIVIGSMVLIKKQKETPLGCVRKSPYIAAGFVSNDTNFTSWRGRLRIFTSQNGMSWDQLETSYPKNQFRDGSIFKYQNTYYLVYTDGLMSTKDFVHWQHLKWTLQWDQYHSIWAPEFFKTSNNQIKIIVAAEERRYSNNLHFKLYTMDFNPKNGHVGNNWQQLTGKNLPTSMIDPNLTYYNGRYHLWYANNSVDGKRDSQLELAVSDSFGKGYHTVKTNINQGRLNTQYEAPELEKIKVNGQMKWVLYQDPYISDGTRYGITYSIMGKNEMHWSTFKEITSRTKIRHFGILAQ